MFWKSQSCQGGGVPCPLQNHCSLPRQALMWPRNHPQDTVTLSGLGPEGKLESDPIPWNVTMRKAARAHICCQSSQHRRPLGLQDRHRSRSPLGNKTHRWNCSQTRRRTWGESLLFTAPLGSRWIPVQDSGVQAIV